MDMNKNLQMSSDYSNAVERLENIRNEYNSKVSDLRTEYEPKLMEALEEVIHEAAKND